MFLKSIQKKAFDAFDDKRFILKGGVDTLAHGHAKIPELLKHWDEL